VGVRFVPLNQRSIGLRRTEFHAANHEACRGRVGFSRRRTFAIWHAAWCEPSRQAGMWQATHQISHLSMGHFPLAAFANAADGPPCCTPHTTVRLARTRRAGDMEPVNSIDGARCACAYCATQVSRTLRVALAGRHPMLFLYTSFLWHINMTEALTTNRALAVVPARHALVMSDLPIVVALRAPTSARAIVCATRGLKVLSLLSFGPIALQVYGHPRARIGREGRTHRTSRRFRPICSISQEDCITQCRLIGGVSSYLRT
jgi:hypothetical protein